MGSNKENPAPISEATPEEEALLERSSAPTLRDLWAAAKDLFTNIEEASNSITPEEGFPRQDD
jgi:hypothetical protein